VNSYSRVVGIVVKAEAALNWQRTSPMAVVFFISRSVRQFVGQALPSMAVLIGMAATTDLRFSTLLSGAIVLSIIGVIASILSYLRFQFCITDNKVLVRSGVIHKEELVVEFNRIQNINIKEPLYMRPFGLVLLSIDTAGSKSKEITLGGIKKPLALTLRATILTQQSSADNDAIDVTADEFGPRLLLKRSSRDIVIYGVTANFMLWIAIAFGAWGSSKELGEDFYLWLSQQINIDGLLVVLQGDGNVILGVMIMIALFIAALLLLPLISVIGALLRYHDYHLSVDGETYRRNSGLLSRHDESMKQHKIQAVIWKQNFVARWFKRTNMQLRVASSGIGVEGGLGKKSTFIVPVLDSTETIDLTAEFLPGCQAGQVAFSPVDRWRYMKKAFGMGWLPIILAISVLPIMANWKFIFLVPLVLAIAWLIVHQFWKKLGYAIVGEYGFMRSGFIGTQVTVFPLFKVQRVDVSQTWFQKRARLAKLSIHLASHSVTLPYIRMEDAAIFRDLALFHVESTDRPWY